MKNDSNSIFEVFKETSDVGTRKRKIKELVKCGVDINTRSEGHGGTVLFHAFYYPPLVKFLIDMGIDVNATDKLGRTALMFNLSMADGDRPQYLKSAKIVLEHGASIKIVDSRGDTAITLARRFGKKYERLFSSAI